MFYIWLFFWICAQVFTSAAVDFPKRRGLFAGVAVNCALLAIRAAILELK